MALGTRRPRRGCSSGGTGSAGFLTFECVGSAALQPLLEAGEGFHSPQRGVQSCRVGVCRTAAALSRGVWSLCFLATSTVRLVFLAWGAPLPLQLWMHEGRGALSSLLGPQQYFFCFLFDKGTCYLTLRVNRHVASNELLGLLSHRGNLHPPGPVDYFH